MQIFIYKFYGQKEVCDMNNKNNANTKKNSDKTEFGKETNAETKKTKQLSKKIVLYDILNKTKKEDINTY